MSSQPAVVVLAGQADDCRASMTGELNRHHTDRTCGAGHDDRFPRRGGDGLDAGELRSSSADIDEELLGPLAPTDRAALQRALHALLEASGMHPWRH
ncbi:hypothetical protein [Nocardia sp. NPDC020380]|uniref:hypothetical protein n=1 Tax=Nocardia sp. NPDC020380 TaxID=3364309 RepID=UPI0037898965